MTAHRIRTSTAVGLLVVVSIAGLTACGEAVDVAPAATVEQELKSREHEAYRDLAEARLRSVKPNEHQGRATGLGLSPDVKPGEHIGRLS